MITQGYAATAERRCKELQAPSQCQEASRARREALGRCQEASRARREAPGQVPGGQPGALGGQPGQGFPPYQPEGMQGGEDEGSSKGSKVAVGILIAAIAAVLAVGAAFFLWTRLSGRDEGQTREIETEETTETDEDLETDGEDEDN